MARTSRKMFCPKFKYFQVQDGKSFAKVLEINIARIANDCCPGHYQIYCYFTSPQCHDSSFEICH